ncbi:MAG: glycosyltransferase [Cytophagales bacterium]|nr:glycosyltransferase [Cytophagales bacterium]
MRVFIIPSWFPSPSHPNAGIFFREQAEMYAEQFSEDKVGLVSWGQNDQRLLLEKSQLFRIPEKLLGARKIKSSEWEYESNFIEWFLPRFTWTRRFFQGNIHRIIHACDQAFSIFVARYGKPDLIHAHVGYPAGFIAWKLSEQHKIPFMITEHMGPFPFADFKKGTKLDDKLLGPLMHSHRNLAVSAHLQRELNRYGIASSVFNNFIDDDHFQVGERQQSVDRIQLLHIGRLAPEKRQVDLLHAMFLLPNEIDFELVIAGEGPLKSDLIQLTKTLGLQGKVIFKGNLNREGIRQQLHRADLFVLSSSYENFPVALLEALACGKPVVATRCGGPEEMVSDVNGLLANPFDPKDLSQKIMQAIADLKAYDAQMIRGDFMDRYSRDQSLKKLREIYAEVITAYHSK